MQIKPLTHSQKNQSTDIQLTIHVSHKNIQTEHIRTSKNLNITCQNWVKFTRSKYKRTTTNDQTKYLLHVMHSKFSTHGQQKILSTINSKTTGRYFFQKLPLPLGENFSRNIAISSLVHSLPVPHISRKSARNFLSCPAHK